MNNFKDWKLSSLGVHAILVCLAALLLLWGLGNPYLRQDEAATAVLAQRMLRFGRPLAYDGVNLITIDHFAAEEENSIDQRDRNPQMAISYYVRHGDFKTDTTWKWQPWGQFVVAVLGLQVLGATTVAARLPFALAGIVTVILVYRFASTHFKDSQTALFATSFLVLNTYWILHSRQCRYYSISSLFLMVTLASYARWQLGKRWGATAFVTAAWCWFQVDYGTVWPVVGVLVVDLLVAERRTLWRPLLVGLAMVATIAPFVYFYELWGRLSVRTSAWQGRFLRNLFNINDYILPIWIIAVALAICAYRWKILPPLERRLVAILCAILVALSFWIPSVAPAAFLRYSIIVAPVGCMLMAWVLMRLGARHQSWTWAGAAIFLFTPWLSSLPYILPNTSWQAMIFRPELGLLRKSVFGHPADPNRPVIDWLKQNAASDDEILINYEDIPLMFYLPNPIRGGIAAFRVEDDARRPPDFIVLRKSVSFVHWRVFWREMRRYEWKPVPIEAPDIACGDCPDPVLRSDPTNAPSILVARRMERE